MEPLKISDDLIAELQDVIVKHDERARDGGVAIQYYAAVIGFVLANQDYPMSQKKEFLNHLFSFANHVFEDNSEPSQPAPQEAMGKWKPGDP